jgi:hypothetical protein
MVASPEQLLPPAVTLTYSKPWGKDAAESIYLFDQEAAKAGLAYHAEYTAHTSLWGVFSIRVSVKDRAVGQEIIDRLNPPRAARPTARYSGWWREVEPTRLSKAYQGHPWVFAEYCEWEGQRDDGLSYTAFLFRDEGRTVFGVKEWLGKGLWVGHDVLDKMAHRVVVDPEFRRGLVSDDPDLPLMWKRH